MSQLALDQMSPQNLTAECLEILRRRFSKDKKTDAASICLTTLLDALDWTGTPRQLAEALPADIPSLSVDDLRNVLARLGFRTSRVPIVPNKVAKRLCPCLLVSANGDPITILDVDDTGYKIVDGARAIRIETRAKLPEGTIFAIDTLDEQTREAWKDPKTWIRKVLLNIRPLLVISLLVSFIVNVLSLSVPLSIMVIYDQVLTKDESQMLKMLILGIFLVTCFDIALRTLRSWLQANAGAKIDFLISQHVFEHIISLSPPFTERAAVGGQVMRIREFESFRELFTGPMTALFLDLPFIFIFIGVIAAIAGPLVLIPVVLGLLYALIAYIMIPELKTLTQVIGRTRSNRYGYLVELMWQIRSIKQLGAEHIWFKRFRTVSADAATANLSALRTQSLAMNIGQSLMIVSGVATLVWGVFRAADGALSLGALIATMMLIWRVLSPIQTVFGLSNRITQLRQSMSQFVTLLKYEEEQSLGSHAVAPIRFDGALAFNRVSFRYIADSNPALLGVNFTTIPGELLGIVGTSGSGKSTIAKLALGLYRPQGGFITIDGTDIRQLYPITFRQTMSYVPQYNYALPGTILDNILAADPTASIERVREACKMAGNVEQNRCPAPGHDVSVSQKRTSTSPTGLFASDGTGAGVSAQQRGHNSR